jgi:signal transduction histidine kinase
MQESSPSSAISVDAVPRILLVDDHPANLLALEAVLSDKEYTFVRALRGLEALARVDEEDFAVVLLDVRMPDLDGFEVAARIREKPRSRTTPIILLTAGDVEPADVKRGYALQAVDFLIKPFDPDALRAKVSVLVDLFLSREAAKQYARRTAMVAHDIRGPLNSITMAARLLGRDQDLTPAQAKSTSAITRGADRILRIVEDLLEASRSQFGGRIALSKDVVDMNGLVEHLVEEFRIAHPGRSIRLDLGACEKISCDSTAVGRAFANLIGNALQHGTADGPVTVRSRVDHSNALLEVHNFGEPIRPEIIPKLFQPFFAIRERASSSNLGLGLYISHRLIAAHGGTLEVRSTKDEGTTFTVCLSRPTSVR